MDKFITWFTSAGLRSLGYLGAGIAAKVLLGSELLLGVGIGVFLADNWVTIKKLIKDNVSGLGS